MSRTIKCVGYWDALVLGSMLQEQGIQVRRPDDEEAPLTMVASGALDGIRAAVAQLIHDYPRSGPVFVEGEAEAAGNGPATGAPDADTWVDPDQLLDFEVVIILQEARYHRSGCTLIRLIGSDDLEILTLQEAEADGYVPCRACIADNPPSAVTRPAHN